MVDLVNRFLSQKESTRRCFRRAEPITNLRYRFLLSAGCHFRPSRYKVGSGSRAVIIATLFGVVLSCIRTTHVWSQSDTGFFLLSFHSIQQHNRKISALGKNFCELVLRPVRRHQTIGS